MMSSSELTAALPREIVLEQMEDFGKFGVDLVAEVAHPDCVRQYGPLILEQTDFFMLSVTAMADASLEEKLRRLAESKNRKLYIAHGATVGLDGIQDGRDTWEKISITMKKNPKNISFDCAKQWDPSKFDRGDGHL